MKFLEEQEKQIYEFILKYKSDFKFREEIDKKYFNEQDSLSILEIYALEEILRVGNKSYFIKFVNCLKEKYNTDEITIDVIIKNYGYDKKNLVLTSNEYEIKRTLTNLLFGELIFDMLDRGKFQIIRSRQKEPGMIANIDKSIIIEELQKGFRYDFKAVSRIVDDMYKFLMVQGGIGCNYFKRYLKYNTNISCEEIMDVKNFDISHQKSINNNI